MGYIEIYTGIKNCQIGSIISSLDNTRSGSNSKHLNIVVWHKYM